MRFGRVGLGCMVFSLLTYPDVWAAVDNGEFTYKGQLKLNSVPVNDTCDFEFGLWRHATSEDPADQVGPTLIFDGAPGNLGTVELINGLFSVLLDFGPEAFNDEMRWLEISVRCPSGVDPYFQMIPRERITGVPYAVRTRGIAVDDNGRVGLGVEQPAAPLHVSGEGTFRGNHVAYFESTGDPSADGIAIQLDNPNTNRDNNFITFYNADQVVAGRIEGFDLENGDWVVPPPLPDINFEIDPGIRINTDWLDLGALPTASFTPGTLPTASLTPGSLPTANFTPGTLPSLSFSGGALPTANFTPGTLPSLSFNAGTLPVLTFEDGSLPSLTFSPGSLPSLTINFFSGSFNFNTGSLPTATFFTGSLPSASLNSGTLPTANFSPGTLPSLSFTPGTLPTANLTPGTLPSLVFSGGSLPSLSFTPGTLPSLAFNGGRLPRILDDPISVGRFTLAFDIPTEADLEALMCWENEHGISNFMGLHPVEVAVRALKEAVAAKCLDEGVIYGSKGADYAEWLPKLNPNDRFQLGQIVGVHGGKVSLKTAGAEQIMAISRAPVVVGNVPPEEEKEKFVTVGFMGQLPVVVHGKVKTGDYIVPSGREDGTAVAVSPEKLELDHLGRTLGRAWSESGSEVFSLVNVVIGVDGNEEKLILQRQLTRLDAQERELKSLAQENAGLKAQLTAVDGQLAALLAAVRNLEEPAGGRAGCAAPALTVADRR